MWAAPARTAPAAPCCCVMANNWWLQVGCAGPHRAGGRPCCCVMANEWSLHVGRAGSNRAGGAVLLRDGEQLVAALAAAARWWQTGSGSCLLSLAGAVPTTGRRAGGG